MMTRAATLALALSLLASSAFAGTASRSFMVGAVVVRSATVTAKVISADARDGVRVEQVASRGTPAPMLFAAGELMAMPQSGAARLSGGSSGDLTVTLVY